MKAFSTDAVASSDVFFSYRPTSEYLLEDEILRFPSAAKSPHEENNTVWARVFDAPGELAVVVLPQWNCEWDGHIKLCRVLQRAGIAALRLSMPYHHFRKPPHLKRPEYMVSANVGQTIDAARQAVLDVRRAADWLLARGYKKLAVLGTSLGSCIGFLTFAHDRRFSACVLIHVSGYFADVVWDGLSTVHVRHSLEGHIERADLRDIWAPISPFPFIRRLMDSDRPLQMFAGRYDPTFLPRLSQQAFDEFDRCHVLHELHWLRCGHYTIGQFPFNAIVARNIVRFMKAARDRT